jgi:hypothetical protein
MKLEIPSNKVIKHDIVLDQTTMMKVDFIEKNHCDSHKILKKRLEKIGFIINDYWSYFLPSGIKKLEIR